MKTLLTSFALPGSPAAVTQDACAAQQWRDATIAVVADGASGAQDAAAAANKVVQSMVEHFLARPVTWSLRRALEEFTRLLNRTLYHESLARHDRVEMVSTLAVVALEGNRLAGVNVGDSRVYLWHDRQLVQLSQDHIEDGAERSHVLRRALGLAAEVQPHAFEHVVHNGDTILLCTDGVSNALSTDELRDLVERGGSARSIVAAAHERASEETRDDATAVMLRVLETGPNPPAVPPIVPQTLAAGDVIDGFTLVRALDEFAHAWLATRAGGERVVLKFPPREARDSEAIRHQFQQEIWNLTRLQAEYFPRAFVPEPNTTLCYAMEYVEAPTLRAVLDQGALAIEDVVTLGKFLADACQFLLRLDLVHGDLKPENILVLREAGGVRFKLIDFGSISQVFTVTSRAGTPSYLAPERLRGAPACERTEIFALGVVLFQALTLTFPYGEVEPFQTPSFHLRKRPSALNPHLPPWLEAVALRCVSVAPEDRYESFSEVRFDLDNPTKVRPWMRRDAPLLERNPLLFYKSGFFLLLVATIFLLLRLLAK